MNIILKDDFEGQINEEVWNLKRINQNSWNISDEQSYDGATSLKITVEKGDRQEVGRDGKNTERAEFSERDDQLIPLGESVWYQFNFFIPVDFLIVDNRLLFCQWKQFYKEEKQSPFLSFGYRNGELLAKVLSKNVEKKFRKVIDLQSNWHKLLVNYQLNTNLTGSITVWLDDQIFFKYHGHLGFEFVRPEVYFKMGLYRDTIDTPQTIYLDHFRRGPTQESCE